eukprot:TRINITY_DN4454_c0_g1_i2.p1 TRINITY_DN4454_c0_g1~~TRINITY_DN4454_c0_g1_i2.p1  ORF type:complete len:103 (+),score=18.40 TRINITY_DN4454_c0_g1_i2:193-501(+)
MPTNRYSCEALSAAAIQKLGDFNSQDLANAMWALATAGMGDAAVFAVLSTAAVGRIGKFNSQQLVNVAWAVATALPERRVQRGLTTVRAKAFAQMSIKSVRG